MVNNVTRSPTYSDLDLDFMAHPTTGDVMKKVGNAAIARSLRNLILTNFYDRPFRSYIGSNVQRLLFENANPITAALIKDAIQEVVKNYEPRVRLTSLDLNFDNDNNGYNVQLSYIIINRSEPAIITLFLERIR